jgi:hypothetical protein
MTAKRNGDTPTRTAAGAGHNCYRGRLRHRGLLIGDTTATLGHFRPGYFGLTGIEA